MGKLFRQHRRMQILLLVLLTGMGLLLSNSNANAQCSVINKAILPPLQGGIENTLPSGGNASNISELGDSRKHKDGTAHTGTDFFFPNNSQMRVPKGCGIQKNSSGNIVWEQNSKKKNGEPAGYGYYMVLDCGKTTGGQTVKMRIAHVPKSPYTSLPNGEGLILQGCSGNAGCGNGHQHFHIETIIGDRPVDTQCVLGITKTGRNAQTASAACKKCPNIGAANLCDETTVSNLISHGAECTHNARRPIEGGTTVDPSTIKGLKSQPDPPSAGNSAGEDGTGMGSNSSTGGTGNTFIPDGGNGGGDEEDPPISPPDPDVPGTPGGASNLVPKPTSGKEAEEFSGCASDTWTAMVNQAVMETRREDILNKRFIVKPDTVLDYACFNFHLKKTADEAGPIFSETKHWANLKVDLIGKTVFVRRELGSKSLDGALMDIVQSVSTDYRRGQFNNPHLAGSTPVGTPSGGKNCDVMNKVWKAAKCKNFDAVDVFYTFDDLRTKEPREFPANMKCDE